MVINENDIKSAIFNIFRDYKATYPNAILSMNDLESKWHKTGLRKNDLYRAAKILINQKHLSLEKIDSTSSLRLTEMGSVTLNNINNNIDEFFKHMQSFYHLERAKKRKGLGTPDFERRAEVLLEL